MGDGGAPCRTNLRKRKDLAKSRRYRDDLAMRRWPRISINGPTALGCKSRHEAYPLVPGSSACAAKRRFGDGMTIHNLFRSSPFGPEEIEVLVAAYEETLRALGLASRGDALTELVAQKIIAIAQTGVRDANFIAQRVLEDLGAPREQ